MNSPSEKTPIHVAYLFSDYVRLHGDTDELWPKLRALGYADKLFIDESNYWAIRFEKKNPLNKNIPLLTLLFLLNDLNVPFAADFKQDCSPAAFMSLLQHDLVLKKNHFEAFADNIRNTKTGIMKRMSHSFQKTQSQNNLCPSPN